MLLLLPEGYLLGMSEDDAQKREQWLGNGALGEVSSAAVIAGHVIIGSGDNLPFACTASKLDLDQFFGWV